MSPAFRRPLSGQPDDIDLAEVLREFGLTDPDGDLVRIGGPRPDRR